MHPSRRRPGPPTMSRRGRLDQGGPGGIRYSVLPPLACFARPTSETVLDSPLAPFFFFLVISPAWKSHPNPLHSSRIYGSIRLPCFVCRQQALGQDRRRRGTRRRIQATTPRLLRLWLVQCVFVLVARNGARQRALWPTCINSWAMRRWAAGDEHPELHTSPTQMTRALFSDMVLSETGPPGTVRPGRELGRAGETLALTLAVLALCTPYAARLGASQVRLCAAVWEASLGLREQRDGEGSDRA